MNLTPTRHLFVLFLVLVMTTSGCALYNPGFTPEPERLGRIGAEIERNPDRMEEILREHGLTEKTFRNAIREVASSADSSRKYYEAFREAYQE